MPAYHYMARTADGKSVSGAIDAPSKYEALSQLYAQSLTVIAMDEDGAGRPPAVKAPESGTFRGWFRRNVSTTDKAVFCRQLAISVSSGISLRDALETIMSDQENLAFRDVLQRVMKGLDDGLPFSMAIAVEGHVFDRLFVALIKAAEESGSMSETLSYLAAALEKSDKLSRKVKSILAYPVFVAVFFGIVAAIMTVFVLPKFQDIFASFQTQLPLMTRTVMGVNRFVISHLLAIVLSSAALAAAIVYYVRTPVGQMQFDTLMLKLPVVGDLIRKVSVARFSRNLGIMIRGGVPVTQAITIAAEVLGNRAMEATLRKTHDRIVEGNEIAASLDKTVFPRLVVRMVSVGEQSGRLPEVLEKVADLYEDQVESSIMTATSLFEPIIIMVFGAIILVLVMAIYLPVFTVAAHAK
jgi:type IV pilus assembly protein PilC